MSSSEKVMESLSPGVRWEQPALGHISGSFLDPARWLRHHGLPEGGLATGTLGACHIGNGEGKGVKQRQIVKRFREWQDSAGLHLNSGHVTKSSLPF